MKHGFSAWTARPARARIFRTGIHGRCWGISRFNKTISVRSSYLDALPPEGTLKHAVLTFREGDAWYRIFQTRWRAAVTTHKSLRRTKRRLAARDRLLELERVIELLQTEHWKTDPAWLRYVGSAAPAEPIRSMGMLLSRPGTARSSCCWKIWVLLLLLRRTNPCAILAGRQSGVLMCGCRDGFSSKGDDFAVQPLELLTYLVVLEAREPTQLRDIPKGLAHDRGIGAVRVGRANVDGRNLFGLEERGEFTEAESLASLRRAR